MRFFSAVIVKVIIFICIIYAVTFCGTYCMQSLAIRTDNYSVYDNENEGGRWGGGIFDELIGSYH